MKVRVEFTASCRLPDLMRALRGVVTAVAVVLIVLLTGDMLPSGVWLR
ncbi:hypothetical protein ABZ816_30545 [Actinosynnema sp. NPDC047251]|nr:hypothetical protein [Saccharothrix espanaensis]